MRNNCDKNENVLKVIQSEQLTSLMNNTKWKKLINSLTSDSDFIPSVYIEYLFKTLNGSGYSPVWWNEVEQDGFEIIEWLDILPYKEIIRGKLVQNKRIDYSDFIKECLENNSINYERSEDKFRIYGYKR